jgi:hypothetical protein
MSDKKLFSPVVVLALVCIFFSCKKINPENNTNQQVSNPESVSQTNNRTFDFLPTSTTSAIVFTHFHITKNMNKPNGLLMN